MLTSHAKNWRITMKTIRLTGAELDYWVAKAEGTLYTANYSRSWRHGGPIIKHEKIELMYVHCNGKTIGGKEERHRVPAWNCASKI
jgi:hypothetical protein